MENIRISNFSFTSYNGISKVKGKIWEPKEVKAVVQISHGMAEHIERYDEFARYLASKGIMVVGNNHLGHGSTAENEEEFGYFKTSDKGIDNASSSYTVVRDLLRITKNIKKRVGDVPYILLGHSMGSFLARRYFIQYGKMLDGIIIMGTGNQPFLKVLSGRMVLKTLNLIYGDTHRSKLFNYLMLGSYNKGIENPSSENSWLSENELNVLNYDNDKQCGFLFTINGFNTVLSTVSFIEKKKNIKRMPKDVPMLLISGKEDPVGNYGKDIIKLQDIYRKAGILQVDLKLYDSYRHEILNETGKEQVYADIYNWIKKACIDK